MRIDTGESRRSDAPSRIVYSTRANRVALANGVSADGGCSRVCVCMARVRLQARVEQAQALEEKRLQIELQLVKAEVAAKAEAERANEDIELRRLRAKASSIVHAARDTAASRS
jgi:hypothetical protein